MTDRFEQLEFQLREGEGCARLSLHGELDVSSAAQFIEQLSFVNHSGVAELTVDLSELSYIDPTGLSVLAVEQQRAKATGMALHIASPSDFVRRMLCITGLIDVLDVSPDDAGHETVRLSDAGTLVESDTRIDTKPTTPDVDVGERQDGGTAPAGWLRRSGARTSTRPAVHPGR